jgi:hypothetical protein
MHRRLEALAWLLVMSPRPEAAKRQFCSDPGAQSWQRCHRPRRVEGARSVRSRCVATPACVRIAATSPSLDLSRRPLVDPGTASAAPGSGSTKTATNGSPSITPLPQPPCRQRRPAPGAGEAKCRLRSNRAGPWSGRRRSGALRIVHADGRLQEGLGRRRVLWRTSPIRCRPPRVNGSSAPRDAKDCGGRRVWRER